MTKNTRIIGLTKPKTNLTNKLVKYICIVDKNAKIIVEKNKTKTEAAYVSLCIFTFGQLPETFPPVIWVSTIIQFCIEYYCYGNIPHAQTMLQRDAMLQHNSVLSLLNKRILRKQIQFDCNMFSTQYLIAFLNNWCYRTFQCCFCSH